MNRISMLLLLVCSVAGLALAQGGDAKQPPTAPVPEVDPSSLITMSALAAGGVLVLRTRPRK